MSAKLSESCPLCQGAIHILTSLGGDTMEMWGLCQECFSYFTFCDGGWVFDSEKTARELQRREDFVRLLRGDIP